MDFGQIRENIIAGSTEGSTMLRCIYGCQKWIPDTIPHRNDDPTFFSTFIFSSKKIILKMTKICFSKISKILSKKYFSFRKFYKGKIFFPEGFLKISEKNIFSFWKWKNIVFGNFQKSLKFLKNTIFSFSKWFFSTKK